MIIENLYKIEDNSNIITVEIPCSKLPQLKTQIKQYLNTLMYITQSTDISMKKKNIIDSQRECVSDLISLCEKNIIYNTNSLELTYYEYSLLVHILAQIPCNELSQYFTMNIEMVNKKVFESYYHLKDSMYEFLWDFDSDYNEEEEVLPAFICINFDEIDIPFLLEHLYYVLRHKDENTQHILTISETKKINIKHESYIAFTERMIYFLEHNFVGDVKLYINIYEFILLSIMSENIYSYYMDGKIYNLNIFDNSNKIEETFILNFYKQCKYIVPYHWNKLHTKEYKYKFHEVDIT